jgi:PIN domain nuclease of toxin-antitoxin system
MRILLDTHLFVWALTDPKRLSAQALLFIEDRRNKLVFSAASLWEITIKRGLGRIGFRFDPRILRSTMLEQGYEELPVLGSHAVAVDSLPPIHKDPFDRILIAQAMVEGITLLTADAIMAQYPGPVRKV